MRNPDGPISPAAPRMSSPAGHSGLRRRALFGVATFFLGIAIIYTDLLREGGWPGVGAIIVIAGIIDTVFAPKLLRKLWEQQDRERR